jgi:hypothetical protein
MAYKKLIVTKRRHIKMSEIQEPVATPVATPAPAPAKPSNGLGIAAIVLGGIGFLFAFIPFLDFATGILPLIGLILGIVALVSKTNKKKGPAIAGTIISAIAAITTILMIVVYTAVFFASVGTAVQESTTPVSVAYDVTGGTASSITYSTYTNGQSGTEQATNQTLPFTKTVTGTKGWSSYSLTAQNSNEDTDITCAISVDGKQVATQTSHGAYALVTCSSTGTAN